MSASPESIWDGEEVSVVAFSWKLYFGREKAKWINAFVKKKLKKKGKKNMSFSDTDWKVCAPLNEQLSRFCMDTNLWAGFIMIGHRIWHSHRAIKGGKKNIFVQVFFFWVCTAMRALLCGLMSEDGRVVRYEVSAAQFGCGSEHNESDWGVFVCGRMFLCTLRMYRLQYVCASECVFQMHNNICSLTLFNDDRERLLRLQPQMTERNVTKPESVTKTHTD